MSKYKKKPGAEAHLTKMSDNPPLPKPMSPIVLTPGDHVILLVRNQRIRDWKYYLEEKEFIFIQKYNCHYSFADLHGIRESFSEHELREIMIGEKER